MFRARKTTLNRRTAKVLDRHTDELIATDNNRAEQLVKKHNEHLPELDGLLTVVSGLYDLLEPVEPSTEFKAELKKQLLETKMRQSKATSQWSERKAQAEKHSRPLGRLVSAIAITAIAAHILGSAIMLVMFIIGIRRRSAAVA